MTVPSSRNMLISSMPGMLLTCRRFKVAWSFFSSEPFLCTFLTFRRMEPLPPMRAPALTFSKAFRRSA